MFHKLRELYGCKLAASDGLLGHVTDFYFDDMTWVVRYLVAETGEWLSGRKVLLTPHAFGINPFGKSERNAQFLRVNLTRKQIEESPSVDKHLPVSRQYEEEYYRYFGWPSYWEDPGFDGQGSETFVMPPASLDTQSHHGHNQRRDLHLRSAKALVGYHIQASDGGIGSVKDLLVDDRSWAIFEVVVETGHWYLGKEILLLPKNVTRISYEESTVFVNLTKEDLQYTRRNDVAQAGTGRSKPGKLHV